jgi:acetyl esterase/lipase
VQQEEFIKHYTRSQRLHDHETIINHLNTHPPEGWNGQFIFLGASEGGALVNSLTEKYSEQLIATMNFSGASDWGWADQVWQFFNHLKNKNNLIPGNPPFSSDIPSSREGFNSLIKLIMENPSADQWMGGMTYLYHCDALKMPTIDYSKIKSPFLVVTGAEDSTIESSDKFIEKAEKAGAPVTYFRINGMDHYVRKRPDVLKEAFDWLKEKMSFCC